MSNLPEKWRPHSLPARRDQHTELEPLEKKIARWKMQSPPAVNQPPASRVNPLCAAQTSMGWNPPDVASPVTTQSILDLPRVCVATGLLWAARYMREPGDRYFRYLRSTVSESYQCANNYRPENWCSSPDILLGIEVCSQCGAFTSNGFTGSIWCPRHRLHVCFGRTSRSGYCHCSCGLQGQLINGKLRPEGYK